MTIAMPDSITVANLPDGFGAYAGYGDGIYQTETELRAKFPDAELLIFTVTGVTAAHGIKIIPGVDDEPGNPDSAAAVRWVLARLAADPSSRPVVYADLASPGYTMAEVISGLSAAGVTRAAYRVLTAHYGHGEHICGPGSCGQLSTDADGTQWSSSFPGVNGAAIDMSALTDSFFGTPQTQWTEFDMTRLPVLREGDADRPGSFAWVVRLQDYLILVGELNGIPAAAGLKKDGVFGPLTDAAVHAVQEHYRVTTDAAGVCGAATYGVLLTGTAG